MAAEPVGSGFRPGVRLGLDWGQARIGVAACDRDGVLCYPVETIATAQTPLRRVQTLCDEYEPIEIVLGMPIDLRGQQGLAAQAMLDVANELASAVSVPVRLVDERMTSASAHRQLAEAGRSSRRRRNVIDQAAAVAILEHAVQAERHTGKPPGRLVGQMKGDVDE